MKGQAGFQGKLSTVQLCVIQLLLDVDSIHVCISAQTSQVLDL